MRWPPKNISLVFLSIACFFLDQKKNFKMLTNLTNFLYDYVCIFIGKTKAQTIQFTNAVNWIFSFFLFFFFLLFRAKPSAYGNSQLAVESELQLPAYATATATQDPSCVFDLHHISWQCRVLNLLSEARD